MTREEFDKAKTLFPLMDDINLKQERLARTPLWDDQWELQICISGSCERTMIELGNEESRLVKDLLTQYYQKMKEALNDQIKAL